MNVLLVKALNTDDPLERARLLNEEVLDDDVELRQEVYKQRALSV